MALYHSDIVDIDLESGTVHRSFSNRIIGEGDNNANRYGVRLFRNGEPANIGGSACQGYFIRRSHGDTVLIDGGTFQGNEAYVTLPQACYAYEGDFTLIIKLAGTGITGTMRIVDGTVAQTTTDTMVDPGHVIPDISELLALIAEMETLVEEISDLGLYVDENGYTCQRLKNE